jgi:hypothetical protein
LIGLFEKGGATDHKSLIFRNLAEAIDYQSEYGGKSHKLSSDPESHPKVGFESVSGFGFPGSGFVD